MLRDPDQFDFLTLTGRYTECELENGLVEQLTRFTIIFAMLAKRPTMSGLDLIPSPMNVTDCTLVIEELASRNLTSGIPPPLSERLSAKQESNHVA
jgi:hypothetical protein